MKTTLTIIICMFLSLLTQAQNGINYKAVIKDDLGNVIANDLIQIQFTILAGASNVYRETHSPTTDSNGIVMVNIGEGTLISGNFTSIDWGSDDHFLNVQLNTGTGLTDMGTTQFKTVPYAITAGNIELPYYDETSEVGAAFQVHNDFGSSRYGLAGSVGTDGEILPANNAGVLGQGVEAHGVYGVSKTSFFAGVQGVSESVEGVGVQGYGYGGGVGGHFYTTSTGVAALTTGRGNVGIGINEPEMKLHVGGDLFIQTNLGELVMGFPDNGNQWQFSTQGNGANLQIRSKVDGSDTFTTRFRMTQEGNFGIGTIAPSTKLHIVGGLDASLTDGSGYMVLGNETGLNVVIDENEIIARSNGSASTLYLQKEGGNISVGDNGANVGINGIPTARLEVFQDGQSVGTGLRFDDGTANSDWNITHGYSLRFHYGGTLKAAISASTGAYVASSDINLKSDIQGMPTVLDRVEKLRPSTYYYKDDESRKQALGFIAQEVNSIFPEVVHFSEADGLYGIDYAAFGVISIKAIQELQAIVEDQQKQIDELKALVQSQLNKN
ncbi:tail fiber domain-containing protein [Bizionia arctica]|uniref:Peptidase S74 domain-containing protein n=1 Tax=Bizionia arctica TaxID=1495645 RepID=A0A917GG45_9FLAO|nr:tail fiber domain-containing protein [Bizionia arctica]GGG44464.1 hypothetical protein GCM10010976_15070 [Bizionia arctica]